MTGFDSYLFRRTGQFAATTLVVSTLAVACSLLAPHAVRAQSGTDVAALCALRAGKTWDKHIQHWRDRGNMKEVNRVEQSKQRSLDACLRNEGKAEQAREEAARINAKTSPVDTFDVAGVRLGMSYAESKAALARAGFTIDPTVTTCFVMSALPCITARQDKDATVRVLLTGDEKSPGSAYVVEYRYYHKPAGTGTSGSVAALPDNFTANALSRVTAKYGEPIIRDTGSCGSNASPTATLLYSAQPIATATKGEVSVSPALIGVTDGDRATLRVKVGAADLQRLGNCLISIEMDLVSPTVFERETKRESEATSKAAGKINAPAPKF